MHAKGTVRLNIQPLILSVLESPVSSLTKHFWRFKVDVKEGVQLVAVDATKSHTTDLFKSVSWLYGKYSWSQQLLLVFHKKKCKMLLTVNNALALLGRTLKRKYDDNISISILSCCCRRTVRMIAIRAVHRSSLE